MPNTTVISLKLNSHVCPSDVGGAAYNPSFVIGGTATPYKNLANGSYKGVSGRYAYTYSSSGAITSTIWRDYGSYVELLSPEAGSKGILTASGVGGVSTTTMAAITDGSSNTLMVGEYATAEDTTVQGYAYRAEWSASWGYMSLGSAGPNSLVRGIPSYAKCAAFLGGPTCRRAFASFPPGGMNFVMDDGHVKWIASGIDANVYVGLATIQGGEIASSGSF